MKDYTLKLIYDDVTQTYTAELNGEVIMECLSPAEAMTVSFGEAIRLQSDLE